MLRNTKFLLVLACLVYLNNPPFVSAADTCCLNHGGDKYCDFSTSQLYCADGSVSASCTCQAAPTPTPVPTVIPTLTPLITPTSIPCPAHATFSAESNACACTTGYVVTNNACVTYMQYCQAQYGTNASYDSGSNACGCTTGYTWNTSGTSCITMDGLCNEKLGSKSYYNSSDKQCYCYQGYAMQNNQCQLIPTPAPPATIAPTRGVPIAPVKPALLPTTAIVVVPTHVPVTVTKAPVTKTPVRFNFNKKVPGLHRFVAVKKQQAGFFETILQTILHVLMQAFNI